MKNIQSRIKDTTKTEKTETNKLPLCQKPPR